MTQHLKLYFDEEEIMHIYPEDMIGLMALKQHHGKLQTYGVKMIEIHTEIPFHDPFKTEIK